MKTTRHPFFYWSLGALFYWYEMILRASISVMAQDLQKSFLLDAQYLGILSSMYYWAYTPLQLPCGIILDTLGVRRLLAGSCLLCGLSICIFSLTPHFWVACLARFAIGAGSACAFISTLSLVIGSFSSKHLAIMAGLTNLMGCLGGISAGFPLAWLMTFMSWRSSLFFLGLGGILLSIFIWVCLKNLPIFPSKEASLGKSLGRVLRIKQLWIIGIIGGLLYLPVSAFAELWGIPFMEKTYSIDNQKASLVPMMLYLGMGFGGPFIAYLCGLYQSYTKIMKACCLFSASIFMVMLTAPLLPFWAMLVCATLLGIALGGQVLVFTLAKEEGPSSMAGTSLAFTNTLVMFFGLIFQPLLGFFIDSLWYGIGGSFDSSHLPLYTSTIYKYAFTVFPLCFLISFFLIKKVKNSYS